MTGAAIGCIEQRSETGLLVAQLLAQIEADLGGVFSQRDLRSGRAENGKVVFNRGVEPKRGIVDIFLEQPVALVIGSVREAAVGDY